MLYLFYSYFTKKYFDIKINSRKIFFFSYEKVFKKNFCLVSFAIAHWFFHSSIKYFANFFKVFAHSLNYLPPIVVQPIEYQLMSDNNLFLLLMV